MPLYVVKDHAVSEVNSVLTGTHSLMDSLQILVNQIKVIL